MKKYLFILILSVSAILSNCTAAIAFDGLVTQVHDGDTLTVLNEKGLPEKIRLYQVDSPEMKGTRWGYQPYASEARTALLNLCAGKIATITRKGISYGRTVAKVSCQDQPVADYLILTGNSWAYRYTATKALRAEQANAQSRSVGLWELPGAIEPYRWRQGVK